MKDGKTVNRLEKGTNRGIYPDRDTIPRSGYNKLHFFFTKSWKFLDNKKLIASRISTSKVQHFLHKNYHPNLYQIQETACSYESKVHYIHFLRIGWEWNRGSNRLGLVTHC